MKQIKNSQAKKIITKLLQKIEITINGDKPYDITVYNEDLYNRVIQQRSLGLGEAYMDSWWDCPQLDEFFFKILRNDTEFQIKQNWRIILPIWLNLFFKINKQKALEVGKKHYDIGNSLYKVMLDKRLCYSCGYWKDAYNLDEAQEAKLDLICRKIYLKKGQEVLDIGSGWGSFIKFAAEKYRAEAIGITISQEQKKLADKLTNGLSAKTEFKDYRTINKKFDRVVSIGMFEHVGHKNYRQFMEIAHKSLKDNGIFLLHTIGTPISKTLNDPWIEKYIFPNSMLPSLQQITEAAEGLFVIEDIHNFGNDYDKTLMEWHKNFTNHWEEIKKDYNDKFYRMWCYYLLTSAGNFRARKIQLWQIVFSKKGILGGYKPIR